MKILYTVILQQTALVALVIEGVVVLKDRPCRLVIHTFPVYVRMAFCFLFYVDSELEFFKKLINGLVFSLFVFFS